MDERSVAVVAVHGVGRHEPGELSAMIAEQLQCASPERFDNFACTPIRIAVDAEALAIPEQEQPAAAADGGRLPRTVGARARGASPAAEGRDATDIDFTAITLAGGRDYADSYITTRLRCDQPDQRRVDVFDMFWADLSHGGTQGGLTALRQTVQLFLHVASLGRTALGTLLASRGAAREKREHIPVLSLIYGASAWGYWLLAVPIALGNILLLCLGAAFFALLVPDSGAARIGTTVAVAIAVACAAGVLLQRQMRREHAASWLQRIGLPAIWIGSIAVAALGLWWDGKQFIKTSDAAFILALATTLLVGTFFVQRYDVSRPGALVAWGVILGACAVWGFAVPRVMRAQQDAVDTLNWFVFFVEGNFAWLVAAWGALAVVNLCLLVSGVYAKYRYRYQDVGHSIDTGLIAASVPPTLLLTVALTLWSAVAHLLAKGDFALMKTQVPTLFGKGMTTVSERLRTMIDLSASPAATPFLVCVVVALACAILAFLPSVMAELLPPRQPLEQGRARGLWRWLNQGFHLLHAAKWITVLAFFLVLPTAAALQYLDLINWDRQGLGLVIGSGTLAYLSVTKLLGAVSLGRLSNAFADLRVVIDTAIDVDNWLRERPVGETPRLRIMARYVSLLDYLKQQGYGRIVLVSHSQGTVITLDLLRYLKARNPEFMAQMPPIDLMTFGSPLRQLYAARFPGIYGWARDPDPADAGVASWCNGYGSGDYIGRNLWNGTNQVRWQAPVPFTRGCYEFCTGALAHIHYFDNHSPDVAAAIMAALHVPSAAGPAGDSARPAAETVLVPA